MSRFTRWLSCPSCEDADVSTLAYRTTIIFECLACGNTDEFEFGKDVPVQQIDAAALADSDDDN